MIFDSQGGEESKLDQDWNKIALMNIKGLIKIAGKVWASSVQVKHGLGSTHVVITIVEN